MWFDLRPASTGSLLGFVCWGDSSVLTQRYLLGLRSSAPSIRTHTGFLVDSLCTLGMSLMWAVPDRLGPESVCAGWGAWSEEPGPMSTRDTFSGQWEEIPGLASLCTARGGDPGSCKRCTIRESFYEAGFLRGILSKSSSSESPRIPLPHLWMSMCTTGGFCAQREAGPPSAVHQLLSLLTCGVMGIHLQDSSLVRLGLAFEKSPA